MMKRFSNIQISQGKDSSPDCNTMVEDNWRHLPSLFLRIYFSTLYDPHLCLLFHKGL